MRRLFISLLAFLFASSAAQALPVTLTMSGHITGGTALLISGNYTPTTTDFDGLAWQFTAMLDTDTPLSSGGGSATGDALANYLPFGLGATLQLGAFQYQLTQRGFLDASQDATLYEGQSYASRSITSSFWASGLGYEGNPAQHFSLEIDGNSLFTDIFDFAAVLHDMATLPREDFDHSVQLGFGPRPGDLNTLAVNGRIEQITLAEAQTLPEPGTLALLAIASLAAALMHGRKRVRPI